MEPCCATSPPPRRMGQCSAKAGPPDAHRVSRSLPLAFSTQQHPVGGPRQGPGLVRTVEQSGRRQRSLGSSIDGVSCQGGGRSDDELAGAAGGLACSLRAADARLCGRWDSFATLPTQRVSAGGLAARVQRESLYARLLAGWLRPGSLACLFLLLTAVVCCTPAATGGHGHHDSVTHAGLTIHKAASWHVWTGQAFAGVMWCVGSKRRMPAWSGLPCADGTLGLWQGREWQADALAVAPGPACWPCPVSRLGRPN